MALAYRFYEALCIALVTLFSVAVVAVVAMSSLSTSQYLQFPPDGLTLRWYGRLDSYLPSLQYSVTISVLAATLTVLISTPAALTMARMSKRARVATNNFGRLPLIVPSVVFALAAMIALAQFEIALGAVPMILALTIIALPLSITFTLAGLASFDWSVASAARTLGASQLGTARTVVIPIIAPTIAIVWGLCFIVSFNDAIVGIFLATPGSEPLPARLFTDVGNVRTPALAAAATSMVLVTTAVCLAGLAIHQITRRVRASART
jgi:putative spermidine/putrescine transport system permease protein